MTEAVEMDQKIQSGFNPMMLIFIVVSVVAGLYFVIGVLALAFPDLGLPFVWAAFPIAPQGPPVSPESLLPQG